MASEESGQPDAPGDPIDELASAWPRGIAESGRAEELARWWLESRDRAIARGEPPFARHPLTPPLRQALFDARRARRLSRGLEEVESRLAGEQKGLDQSGASRPAAGRRRISRLLLVSADGAPRFYRRVETLTRRHAVRLEALVLECDAEALGEAAYGPGRTARALLLDHREQAAHWLGRLLAGL